MSRGLRLTRQRRTILGVVETAKQHLDANEILRQARKLDPGIDRVTVYRTLNLLKHHGLIDELDLMHMQGEPRTMQDSPHYDDVVAEVCEFLARERDACIEAGIAREAIVLDPGIGFGKGLAHNLTLLKELSRFAALGAPLLVGVSRKSFIGRILGRAVDERLYGGLGLAALAVIRGARIVRTHDVAATCDTIGMVSAVLQGIDS